jgi:hypothetical protein
VIEKPLAASECLEVVKMIVIRVAGWHAGPIHLHIKNVLGGPADPERLWVDDGKPGPNIS